MKKLAIFVLLILSLRCTSVFGGQTVTLTAEEFESLRESSFLNSVAELIFENYAGGEISREELYKNAIKGMTAPLDIYSEYMFDDEAGQFMTMIGGSTYGIGIVFYKNDAGAIIISSVNPGSPAESAGIMAYDEMISVGGRNVFGMEAYQIADLILEKAEQGELIEFTIKRAGRELKFQTKMENYKTTTVFSEEISSLVGADKKYNDSIGYIRISSFMEPTAKDFEAEVKKLINKNIDSLILDLRNNPGGNTSVAIQICQSLVKEGVIFTSVAKNGEPEAAVSSLKAPIFKNLVVLVNENSSSASELVAGAVKDSKSGIVVGRTTFGKGVMQELLEFDIGGILKLTTHENFTRNGAKINGVGITPDIIVDMPEFIDYTNYDQENLIKLLGFLGYDVSSDKKLEAALKSIQKAGGLDETGELNGATAYEINLLYAENQAADDKILKEGFNQLLKLENL